MFAITGNPIDLAFCALLVVAVVLYLAANFYRDRHQVKFSSMRQMFDVMDDWTPEDHVEYFGLGNEYDPEPKACFKCGEFDTHAEYCEHHPDNQEDAF